MAMKIMVRKKAAAKVQFRLRRNVQSTSGRYASAAADAESDEVRFAAASANMEAKGVMHEGGPVRKFFSNKLVLVSLAVAILIILAVIRFGNFPNPGLFDRSLDKLDTCKGGTDLAAKNSCYRDLAFSMNKTYFCNKVFNSSRITESCFAKLAVDANSKKACEQLSDVKVRGFCLRELAVNKVELPLCGNIDDKFWKNSCYGQLAILLKKPDPCSMIEGEAESADCYLTLAKNISSGPACAYIADQPKKDECFLAVGVANSDPLLCAEIVEPANKWTCYHRIAKSTGNVELCKRVPVVFRQNCVDAVKAASSER